MVQTPPFLLPLHLTLPLAGVGWAGSVDGIVPLSTEQKPEAHVGKGLSSLVSLDQRAAELEAFQHAHGHPSPWRVASGHHNVRILRLLLRLGQGFIMIRSGD